jgi:predicted ATPase/class 3 adenylate cyclase
MTGLELPTGTVTFLFTDIEGSTRLMEDLGEELYVEALAEHRRLLRAAFAAHGGVEVDTQGDAFLYVFADAEAALEAAVAGQRALASGPVSVRMGIHTGDARLTGEGYAGRELHRAARIAASGHGGQVVVSAATHALVDGDAQLAGLGEHRLKDFPEPVALFQLGQGQFPPLKTISNTNLPRPVSSFVGRAREQEELVDLLSDGKRLVTLTGPGGSGKTRLAVEAATELIPAFAAGVFWVELAPLRDPALVTETIAQVLGAKDGLVEHVGEREMLLLLDNFEQVIEAATELGPVLERCPKLRLLVTSRELLRIDGEVEYSVLPLQEPEAVALFCERSQLEPDETVAEICRRLDELPLAIELAAARASVLSPEQMLERLAQRLDLLKGGRDADDRQRTLRATIEWSYELLSGDEQRLFAGLAIFRGGCTLEAAEEVAGADLDTLQSLVEKSLLRHTDDRFWMLETIRAYAWERLSESSDEAELRRRHALLGVEFAESTYQEMVDGGDQATISARIDVERDNLRAALEWARDEGEDDVLLRLAAPLARYWPGRGLYQEGDMWNGLALERPWSRVESRMLLLRWAAARTAFLRDYARSDALVAEWRGLAEGQGDESEVLLAMNSAALNASEQGDHKTARAQFRVIRERAQEIGKPMMVAFATINLGGTAWRAGDFREGLEESQRAVELFREGGDDSGVANALENCGWTSLGLSDPAGAKAFFHEALEISGHLGWLRGIAVNAVGFGASVIAEGDAERGVQLLAAAASLRAELGIELTEGEEKRPHDEAVAQAKAALGEDRFAAACARGEGMKPEEIVAFAVAG